MKTDICHECSRNADRICWFCERPICILHSMHSFVKEVGTTGDSDQVIICLCCQYSIYGV